MSGRTPLLLIGGGGHARACIDVIEKHGQYAIIGILDSSAQGEILGYPILGDDTLLESLRKRASHAFISIGQIESKATRHKIYQKLKNLGYTLPHIISPLAYVSASARISEATIIMHHALINANATIGTACIINSKALIEHDCVVEDFCHLSTASVVNGGCHIGAGSFIGSNMVLRHNSAVKPDSILYHNPLESRARESLKPRHIYSPLSSSPRGAGAPQVESASSDSKGILESEAISKSFVSHLTGGGDRLKLFAIPYPTTPRPPRKILQNLPSQHAPRSVA